MLPRMKRNAGSVEGGLSVKVPSGVSESRGSSFAARAIAALSAFAWLMCLCAAAGVQPGTIGALACMVSCAAGSACTGGIVRGWRALPVVPYVVAAILCIVANAPVLGGFFALVQGFQNAIFQTWGYLYLDVQGVSGNDLPVALVPLGLVLGALCSTACRRGMLLPALVLAAVTVLAAWWGWLALSLWSALLVAALLAWWAFSGLVRSRAQGKLPLSALIPITGTLLALCLLGAGVGFIAAPALESVSLSVRSFVDQTLLGGARYALTQGNLNDNKAFAPSGESALRLELHGGTGDPLYLRGFIGESYELGAWTHLDRQLVRSFGAEAYWLDADQFAVQEQPALAAEAAGITIDSGESSQEGTEGLALGSMTITNVGARQQLYTPYALAGTGDLLFSALPSWPVKEGDVNHASYEMLWGVDRSAYVVQDALSDATAASAEYLSREETYRQFVYEAYAQIPDDIETALESLVETQELTVEQAKLVTRGLLERSFSYTDSPQDIPEGEDPLIWFLTQSRQGHSVQYASAAVFLLRYFGVPARYVEGYYVSDTAGASELAVTENEAHAWAEYYLDGVGWLPFEVTPGYEASDYYRLTDNVLSMDDEDLQSVMNLIAQAPEWEPDLQEDDQEPDPQEDESDQGGHDELAPQRLVDPWTALLVALLVLLAAALAVVARVLLVRRRLARLYARIAEDGREGVALGFSYLILLCTRCYDCEFQNRSLISQGAVVEQAGACSQQLFRAAAKANEWALFGGDIPSDQVENYRENVLSALAEAQSGLKNSLGTAKFALLRWLGGLF